MKLVTYFDQNLELEHLDPEIEYIFSYKSFSRQGNLDLENGSSLMINAIESGFCCVLEIDVLVCEQDFEGLLAKINKLDPRMLKLVRLQDPGIIDLFVNQYPESKIQLVLETGNHNLIGIKRWCDFIKSKLDRIILSIELPKDKLKEIISELNISVEILGFGPILVFYTPRKLLSSALEDESLNDNELYALGKSEESPHKGFPIFENAHGTFMYHIKDFCLLAESSELQEMGLSFFRFDPRISEAYHLQKLVKEHIQGKDHLVQIKEEYKKDLMRGYYRVNKTNILFPKLKNNRIKRSDLSFCGAVLEIAKEHYIAIEVKENKIKIGNDLKFITPEGKEVLLTVKSLRNTQLMDQQEIPKGQIALVSYRKGVWPKSSVYYQ